MEKLSDDEVGQIMRRVRSRSDRRACAQVCSQWHRVEGLTRNSLRILDPQLMHQFLPHFRNLLSIEAQMEVCDRDLECMAENCRSLQVLNLYLSKWRRVMDLEFLSTYQDFKPLGDDGVVAIANNCKDLQHVSLRWRQGIGDIAVSALARSCSLLVYLDLGHCKRITDRSLEAVSHLECLEVLILRNCNLITDWGLSYLANGATNKRIKRLDLCECDQLTDSGAVLLQQLSALQVLNLAECGPNVTDVGGTGIAGVTTLQSLNLAWLINVSDVSIITIAHHCVDMEELNLSGCELVTGTGLRAFAGHKKLRALTLSSCSNIHSDDVDATASSCLALHYLCLDRGLRPWMPEECLERLQSRKIEIEWL
ncbi:hypothetical protein MPTK1_3g25370 [Marchantia polymorpha subsp. ruderalis]|uniref:COI1 F-box domain-containing protein n=2 Tax=Marchantia polymorpha TaxID=3197 RepID=A0AAF6B4N2_MARPO|nr:hypothetical protein MARPO_0100s0050 [Marchantia polymorpha]BBN06966.1 hypothetical protein Mp_3g25370 [Marchantia polymorpha subsp. ruderalis]|eukprot:PTQ32344.1 hypothetical protein MARPO_0100s0050 [Marchantia polymorpha]